MTARPRFPSHDPRPRDEFGRFLPHDGETFELLDDDLDLDDRFDDDEDEDEDEDEEDDDLDDE